MKMYFIKIILLLIISFQIFGCAESSDDEYGSNYSSSSSTCYYSCDDDSDDWDTNIAKKKPEAISDSIDLYYNHTTSIQLRSNSNQNYGYKKYFISKSPRNGRISGTPPNIKYTPNSGFVGDDEILFRVRIGGKESDSGVIKLKILNDNTPPSPRAVEEGSTSIMISWEPIQGASSYRVYREDQENRGFL